MSPSSNFANNMRGPVNPNVPDALNLVHFSPYQRKGVIIMAVAGVISCAFVFTLLLAILFSAVIPCLKPAPGTGTPFIKKHIAVFVICLLLSDLIQSISGIIQVKWAIENSIYEGGSCTIQAATLVMGDLASTIWSCVVAVHTFTCLALGKQWPRWVVYATVIVGWSFVISLTIIGPAFLTEDSKGAFFGIAGMWCFIKSEYAIARLGLHYIPLFIAAGMIFIFYGLVFLVLRGRISFMGRAPLLSHDASSRERVKIAKRMLWYPLAYLTCILPIAIMRLIGLSDDIVPDGVWIFGMFFLFLLGAADSVIYATTRNLIKPFNTRLPTRMPLPERPRAVVMLDDSSTRNLIKAEFYGDMKKASGLRPGETVEEYEGRNAVVVPGLIRVTTVRTQNYI